MACTAASRRRSTSCGSYLDKSTSIPQNAFIVVGADTLVALLAGFAIFPLVFAHGMQPDAGEGLVFQALPVAFGDLPAGSLFASVFFFLLIEAPAVGKPGHSKVGGALNGIQLVQIIG